MINISILKLKGEALVRPTPVTIDWETLSTVICDNHWSHITFNGARKSKNFKATDLIVLDFDNHLSLEQAKLRFKDYQHIIATTRSHQVLKNGIVSDRFRVILKLESTITDSKVYTSTIRELLSWNPEADLQCSDTARGWYSCTAATSINNEGKALKPASPSSTQETSCIVVDELFGARYEPKILQVILELMPKGRRRLWKESDLARFIADNVTRLRRGKAGFGVVYMARMLRVTMSTSSKILKQLVALGILKVTDASYKVGERTKMFGLGERLVSALNFIVNTISHKPWHDGESNGESLKLARGAVDANWSLGQYLAHAESMQAHRPYSKRRTEGYFRSVFNNWKQKILKFHNNLVIN